MYIIKNMYTCKEHRHDTEYMHMLWKFNDKEYIHV